MKIYTKTGDDGVTALYGGQRVSKSSARISSYGDVDELSSVLGIVVSFCQNDAMKESLLTIQRQLFQMGAYLASPHSDPKIERINASHVEGLERQIDVMNETLPTLQFFILPGGTQVSAFLHLARTVCRRAERSTVHLSSLPQEKVDMWILIYLNRLSDFLFTMARLANHSSGVSDVFAKG